MTQEQLVAYFLSIWFGFSVSYQLHAQATQDKVLTDELGKSGWWCVFLSRFIFMVIGLLGVTGMGWLFGNIPGFKGAPFPVGMSIGIVFFLLTRFLNKKGSMGGCRKR